MVTAGNGGVGHLIAIDTGTTNTRAFLLDPQGQCLGVEKAAAGVRDTAITGSREKLRQAVGGCLSALLDKQGLRYDDIKLILASGMITSSLGLVEIPHLTAPVSLAELAAETQPVLVERVCPKPIYFIPGIKNRLASVGRENFEAMDIMRGEEVEVFALLERVPKGRDYLVVLPGSHTKFVAVDRTGRITGCMTTLAGELLDALTSHTILTDAVGRRFADAAEYDRETVLAGYETAKKAGVSRAAFITRIRSQFVDADKGKTACYLLGAVLQGDVAAVLGTTALKINRHTEVIVSGKDPLRQAMADILEFEGYFASVRNVCIVSMEQSQMSLPLSAAGALLVAREMKIS